jgi:exopolysaccharide biosynthesis polyprenyl glycosylphosphotransferase
MLSGGLEATDGGSTDACVTGVRAVEAPTSAAAYDESAPDRRNRFRQPHWMPAAVLRGRNRPAAYRHGRAAGSSVPPRGERWVRRYQAVLIGVDLTAAATAIVLAYLIRFGVPGSRADPDIYRATGVALPLVWVCVVGLNRAYEGRFVGVGSAEFQRVFRAFLHVTALVSFVSFAAGANLSRGFIVVALPLSLGLDVIGRYAARKYLHIQRSRGRAMRSVLVVGDWAAIAEFSALVRRDRHAGLEIVGACLPGEVDDLTTSRLEKAGIRLVGTVDGVRDSARSVGADTIAVLSSGQLSPEKLRWISWQLEGSDTQLMVSPGLTEVAGPRLHIQPVAGLPLLHVEQPQFAGFRRLLKSALDRTVAGLSLLLLLPVLLGLAFAVRFNSRGPALFRQTRVGRNGETFTMVKFRSMYVDAEHRLADLQAHNVNADGLLFKMRDDPRVTRVGKFLRNYSLDELPQLINIMTGRMSLVGPRPPLPSEVHRYGDDVRRRLLVKPGLTGLWQVSGRSDLSWEESVRLDLRYVENWSPALDLMILWKTAFAVLGRSGAY